MLKTLLTEETLVAEQIQSLFYEGKLPEIDYDAAKVVKDEDSEFNDGKFGKSMKKFVKEQLEDGKRDESEDRKEEKILLRIKKEADKSDEKDEPAHPTSPKYRKPTIQITQTINNPIIFSTSFYDKVIERGVLYDLRNTITH